MKSEDVVVLSEHEKSDIKKAILESASRSNLSPMILASELVLAFQKINRTASED